MDQGCSSGNGGSGGATLTVWVDASPKQRHGRLERRELWALADPELNGYTGSAGTVGEAWPHRQQSLPS